MERGRLTLNQATMVATDMEAMVATDVATTERGRLMLSQDTPEAKVMVAMDVATTERGRLMLSQDTPEAMVMVVMDMETMARGKQAGTRLLWWLRIWRLWGVR